ncbi:MAG: PilT [Candidatus Amesbacteria bacterium GW2011_GWB1_47_26]|uniref:PilT n=1 Tax=Candidatus Amesbacteria bacterium GW2011_GWC2_45_19 TaxID=1618366 RepID=A0A0G1M388_9BACT|nr:MAG: PilT [Candidatus Amesbacteria bacterium GW2011_GWC2_45_19]KKU38095.1 MAG: PilT [Candidatus Amesbacteria bacterium GW2011_GWA1_46_35]KKU69068.1 MAG: PilT [Microgenomates group bacterium GW2011_GWC1_47_20]KKU74755.1 MAG: PilT [Candidatus Amesbacteria bacterium GW2011_GWB1_47_26]KKU80186.1 MAG: PilT [Candidatus Amesbacteria bacterium GW2011_GWA2_47_70]
MIVLDTSTLVRFFTRDDESKARKVKILLESDEELLLIDAVVMELIYTLIRVYGQSKDQILEIFRFLLSRANIQINSELRKAIKVYEEENISITDSLLVIYGQNNKIASFDDKLLKIKGTKGIWK